MQYDTHLVLVYHFDAFQIPWDVQNAQNNEILSKPKIQLSDPKCCHIRNELVPVSKYLGIVGHAL